LTFHKEDVMNKPYIGVTGFMSRLEVRTLLVTIPPSLGFRQLMVGVLVSEKTLSGRQNRWPHRYPKVEEVKQIFVRDQRVLNLIHFNTDTPPRLLDQMTQLVEIGGDHLHGLQLNVAWPDPEQIRKFREMFPEQKIVIQVGGSALKQIDHSPTQLVDRLRNYHEIAEYFLLDPSGGLGKPFDPDWARLCLETVWQAGVLLRPGIAGGLHCWNLNVLNHFWPSDYFQFLSIDAEGKLRDEHDDLDSRAVYEYVSEAKRRFEITLTSK